MSSNQSSLEARRFKAGMLTLALWVLAADQWSKWAVERWLDPTARVEVVPGAFNLIHVANTGIAFGLFPARGQLLGTLILTALSLLALTVVASYYRRTPATERSLLASLSLILGGALGNLVDRVMKGSVTDFLDVYLGSYHWPTFNVADSAITVGITLLAVETLRPRRSATSTGDLASTTE